MSRRYFTASRSASCSSEREWAAVVGDLQAHVWETPGHCADHVSYWFETERVVFAADVLFTLGCGRVRLERLEWDPYISFAVLE